MGLAATQGRMLSLQSKQSDLEYQGQQINNERTILSQQVTNLYNSLLMMDVPTPPSTSEFTRVVYSGTLGTTNYEFEASSVRPGNNGGYNVTINELGYGHSAQKNPAYATVETSANPNVVRSTTNCKYNTVSEDKASGYMVEKTVKAGDSIDGLFTKNGTSFSPASGKAQSNGTYYVYKTSSTSGAIPVAVDETAEAEALNHAVKGDNGYYAVDDNAVFTLSGAKEAGLITSSQYNAYKDAIKNSGICDKNGEAYDADAFYLYFDENGNPNFVLREDIEDGNNNAVTYSYVSNGSIKKPTNYVDCALTFDPATGRITEVGIPIYDENTGEITGYTYVALTASNETDEVAYDKAYADYEYQQYLYDKAQVEINAKTEAIQQQDKNLELQLERLDNERTQITTEMEALDKVIKENIESSYKTFSG